MQALANVITVLTDALAYVALGPPWVAAMVLATLALFVAMLALLRD